MLPALSRSASASSGIASPGTVPARGVRREAHVPVHDLGDDLCGGLVGVPAVEVLGGQRLRGHWVSIGSWIEESGFHGTSGGLQEGVLV
jgi:hypothetical protein